MIARLCQCPLHDEMAIHPCGKMRGIADGLCVTCRHTAECCEEQRRKVIQSLIPGRWAGPM